MTTCNWNWCMRTFPDSGSLIEHVEQDHIAKAVPVKRKDVPLLLRAEDGASLQESVIPQEWVSGSDGSQSLEVPRRVECGVMTDPITLATMVVTAPAPLQDDTSSRILRSRPCSPAYAQSQPLGGHGPQVKFSELRGTPSPAPSFISSSPGTTAIINKMKQRAPLLLPTGSEHVPSYTTSHTPYQKMSARPGSSIQTPRENGPLPYTLLTPLGGDDSHSGGERAAGPADPDTSVDFVETHLLSSDGTDGEIFVKSVLNPLQSQWQPQSQLPLTQNNSDTFDPDRVLASPSLVVDSQSIAEHGELDRNLASSKSAALAPPTASQNAGAPLQLSSPAPSPLSLSAMDVSKTPDSRESILRISPSRILPSSTTQPSSTPAAACTANLGQTAAESQRTDFFAQELPFDFGFGYGYGDGNKESPPLQTQAPLPQSSFDTTGWSQN